MTCAQKACWEGGEREAILEVSRLPPAATQDLATESLEVGIFLCQQPYRKGVYSTKEEGGGGEEEDDNNNIPLGQQQIKSTWYERGVSA